MTLAAWHAERSLAEGLQRGLLEALVLVAAFVALGRLVGAGPRAADREARYGPGAPTGSVTSKRVSPGSERTDIAPWWCSVTIR